MEFLHQFLLSIPLNVAVIFAIFGGVPFLWAITRKMEPSKLALAIVGILFCAGSIGGMSVMLRLVV